MARLGIDIGRVIIGPVIDGREDTSFLGRRLHEAMQTPPAPGAFEAIAALVPRFEGTWLVSKCGPSVQRKSLAWLDHHRFYDRTGVPRDHVRFCLERRDKAIWAEKLELTHFIDDRVDVLRHLRGLVGRLYLFGEQDRDVPAWASHVETWAEAQGRIVRDLGRGRSRDGRGRAPQRGHRRA